MSEVARLKPAGGPIFSLVADSTSLGNHKQVSCLGRRPAHTLSRAWWRQVNSIICSLVGDSASLGDCKQVSCPRFMILLPPRAAGCVQQPGMLQTDDVVGTLLMRQCRQTRLHALPCMTKRAACWAAAAQVTADSVQPQVLRT